MRTAYFRAWLGAILLTFIVPTMSAQSIWVGQDADKVISLELMKPSFDGDDRTSLSTGVAFASFRVPVGESVTITGELPFAHYGYEGASESDDVLGNPYLGIEYQMPGSPVFWELGVRPPVTPEDNSANFIGLLTDPHRWESFLPNVASVKATINYHVRAPTGLVARLRAGPNLWIPTQEGPDPELIAVYSAQIGHEGSSVSILGGIAGQAIITEESMDFNQRTNNQLGAILAFTAGNVRPGLYFHFPLDEDARDTINFVFGFNISVLLP